jgi:hypothetical protein
MTPDHIREAADRAEAAASASAGGKQDTRFKPGQSGNPRGKRPGTRAKATQMVEAMLAGEGEDVARAVIAAAISGDMVAARLVLERICPPRKGRAITLDLPAITNASDLAGAQQAIVSAMATGEITTDEATDAAKVLELVGAAMERRDLEARVAALEEQSKESGDAE